MKGGGLTKFECPGFKLYSNYGCTVVVMKVEGALRKVALSLTLSLLFSNFSRAAPRVHASAAGICQHDHVSEEGAVYSHGL